MSDLTDAFEEALDAAEEAKGLREKVTFRSVELDALFNNNPDDWSPVAGGDANTATVDLSLRKSDIELPFEDLEPITVRGVELAVISFTVLEGRIDVTAGDPAAQAEG